MANPRVSKQQRENRGTLRKDRDYDVADEEDQDEKIPRRPSYLTGHAEKFWYRHARQLFDDGWLKKKTVETFIHVCKMYGTMMDLEEFLDEHGAFYDQEQKGGIFRPTERPESKRYEALREKMIKHYLMMGIAEEAPKASGKKKDDKKSGKANIRDFTGLKAVNK